MPNAHTLRNPLIVCDTCGTVVLACHDPDCAVRHPLRTVLACGACTQTGGMPARDTDEKEIV